jgi:hypothetical protein
MIINHSGWRDLAPAVALLFLSAVGVLAAGLSPTGDHGQYVVVAPPWYDAAETAALIGATGGDIVEFGGFPNVVIAHSKSPLYVRALYRGGAWLVIDPQRIRGCLRFDQNPVSS